MKIIFLIALCASSFCFGDRFFIASSDIKQSNYVNLSLRQLEEDNVILEVTTGNVGEYIIRYKSSKWPSPK